MDLSSQLQSVSILPEIVLSVFGIIVMLSDPFIAANKSRRPLGILAFVGTLAEKLLTYATGRGVFHRRPR